MLTEKILLLLRFLYFYTTPPAYPSLFREAIKKHRLYFILFICLMSATCMGQTYNMSNTTINTCSGTFFDSGGAGNYSNNQLITMTFCSSIPGADLVIEFTSFDVESGWDFLTIYDGSNTTSPQIGTYSGTTSPGTFTSSNGCLTFVFDSDGSVTQGGWSANISCAQPCQPIDLTATFNPLPSADGIIYLCVGDELSMDGSTIYPSNGSGYTQSDATSIFEWSTQDGPNQTGQNVTHTFNSPGAYTIQLEVVDVNGCENDIDNYPVSYTHLTLPTKRIV